MDKARVKALFQTFLALSDEDRLKVTQHFGRNTQQDKIASFVDPIDPGFYTKFEHVELATPLVYYALAAKCGPGPGLVAPSSNIA